MSSLDEECVGSEPSDSTDQCGARAWSDVAMAFLVKWIGHNPESRRLIKVTPLRTSTSSCDDGNAPRRSGDTTASTNIRNRSYKPEDATVSSSSCEAQVASYASERPSARCAVSLHTPRRRRPSWHYRAALNRHVVLIVYIFPEAPPPRRSSITSALRKDPTACTQATAFANDSESSQSIGV